MSYYSPRNLTIKLRKVSLLNWIFKSRSAIYQLVVKRDSSRVFWNGFESGSRCWSKIFPHCPTGPSPLNNTYICLYQDKFYKSGWPVLRYDFQVEHFDIETLKNIFSVKILFDRSEKFWTLTLLNFLTLNFNKTTR